jgi:hypothetical protein
VDRFISGYKYITDPEKFRRSERVCTIRDINEFAQQLTNSDFKYRILRKKYTDYLSGDPEKTYVVLYDSADSFTNIQKLFAEAFGLEIERSDSYQGCMNVSRCLDDMNYEMTADTLAKVREYFADDLALYERMKAGGRLWYCMAEM